MATTAVTSQGPSRGNIAKYVLFAVYAALMVVVWYDRDRLLLNPASWLRQRYAPVTGIVLLHGIPGSIALFLGILQFSTRLRRRFLNVHRIMGRIYVGCVFIAGPAALVLASKLPIPSLTAASWVQSAAWILTTATGLYCVRTGKIQLHREWMLRSYPFAAVFVFNRAVLAVPSIARMGLPGVAEVVWTGISLACFLPSVLIEWQHLAAANKSSKARATAMGD